MPAISDNVDEEGEYKVNKYKLNFSPDIIYGAAGYDTFYGVSGSTVMAFSDMLGDHQIVFFDIDPIGEIPLHSHGEQWGIVVEGEMDLSIGGQTKRYKAGDSYHIPAGVTHGAKFLSRVRAIDVFADRDRYKPKR